MTITFSSSTEADPPTPQPATAEPATGGALVRLKRRRLRARATNSNDVCVIVLGAGAPHDEPATARRLTQKVVAQVQAPPGQEGATKGDDPSNWYLFDPAATRVHLAV